MDWMLAAAAAVAAVTGAGGCGGGGDAQPAPAVRAGAAAEAFAPIVWLHREERLHPMSPERFIDRSTLKLRGDVRCGFLRSIATGRIARRKTPGDIPRLTPRDLGTPPGYRQRLVDSSCRRGGPRYSTTQHTRPYGSRRPAGLRSDEGFYMDLLTDSRDGDARVVRRDGQRSIDDVPVFYDRRPVTLDGRSGIVLTYWLLYGGTLKFGESSYEREGDWERIAVLLERQGGSRRYVPVAVRLYADGRPRDVPWDAMSTVNAAGSDDGPGTTHPVIYSARGNHTPYHEPGRHERTETLGRRRIPVVDVAEGDCAECARVETWRLLRDVRAQPWYGYGGGWGLSYMADETSGPLGPSPFLR